MSLDRIINFVLNGFDFSDEKRYSEIHINKKFIRGSDNSSLKIILPPWGDGEPIVTKILIRRLHKRGHSCLAYFFPKHILSPNIDDTASFFKLIQDQIKSDISRLKTEYSFKKVDIIAPSLGVVNACLIANDNDDIQNLFFIVPGSCLASSLWNGIRTQKLKNIYERQNISQEQLKTSWGNLAPKNNLDAMRNKNIFISISKSDKVIPYCFGKELADLAKKLYPNNAIVQENSCLGHYLTIVKYYLFDKELLK